MELVTWGSNSAGQLGIGSEEEEIVQPFKIPTKIKFTRCACGGEHSILYSVNSALIAECGSNAHGELSFQSDDQLNKQKSWKECLYQEISNIWVGWERTFVQLSSGEVVACGSNSKGQLGLYALESAKKASKFSKHIGGMYKQLTSLPINAVQQVACGLYHTLFLLENGQVLGSGEAKYGQLGLERKECLFGITPLGAVEARITEIACGARHSVFLTDAGKVLVTGDGKYGQLGLGNNILSTFTPRAIETLQQVCRIRAMWYTTIVVLVNGPIYGTGRNDLGQLGLNHKEHRFDPVQLEFPYQNQQITHLSCGSEHIVAVTNDKKLWVFGWNEHGQCGVGNTKDQYQPVSLSEFDNQEIIDLACGGSHNVVLINPHNGE